MKRIIILGVIWDHVFGIYSRGKLDLAKEAAIIDPNVIQ